MYESGRCCCAELTCSQVQRCHIWDVVAMGIGVAKSEGCSLRKIYEGSLLSYDRSAHLDSGLQHGQILRDPTEHCMCLL